MAKRSRNSRNRGLSPRALVIIFALIIIVGVIIWLAGSDRSDKASVAKAQTTAPAVAGREGLALEVALPSSLSSEIIDYEGYTVSFNKDNHTPNYCAWELTADETNGQIKRSNKFQTDYKVKGCPSTSDYTHSGYDRGHMVPANDMKWSEQSMNDCFYMTNICPQQHELNNGAWKTLELKSQDWARRDGILYIIAGPIYTDNDRERIGETGVRVPSSFYKVIVAPNISEPRGIAFVYPNMQSPGNMKDYSCTIDQVEELTGLDFFPNLSPELEHEIESIADFKEWNRKR